MRRTIWLILCAPLLVAACQSSGGGGGWAEKACRERLPNASAAEIKACTEREYRRERARTYSPRGP